MEKMQLGSPASSPAQATPFLPNFLMGENTPTTNQLNRSFSNSPNAASPDFGRTTSLQQKFLTNLQSPTPFNSNSLIIQQQQQQPALFQTQNQSNANNNPNASISGPPINSLYDNLRSERSFQTPTKSFINQHQQQQPVAAAQNSMLQDTPTILNRSGFNQSRIMSPIPNVMADFNNSYQVHQHQQQHPIVPSYPTGIQPSFNQSMNVKAQEFWVTVFGFPSESTSIVLSHFSAVGTILDKVCSTGNWIHLRYSSRGECDKAMLYNGKIIGNNLMIGVTRCTDESVYDKENVANDSQISSVSKIRSLTQSAYASARQESEVLRASDDPKKTHGIMSRAVDLLFGW